MKKDPKNPYKIFQLADILYTMGRLDETSAQLDALQNYFPYDPRILIQVKRYRDGIAELKSKQAKK